MHEKKYLDIVTKRYIKKRFYTAIDFKDKTMLKIMYKKVKQLIGDDANIYHLYLRNKYIIF